MQVKGVTLGTIAGGALEQLFGAEMDRVMANIADINTDPNAKRTITMSVEITPEGVKRDTAKVSVKCNSKLAGIMKVNTQFFMGKQGGKLVAVENDINQGSLFDPEQPKPLAAVAQGNFAPSKEQS